MKFFKAGYQFKAPDTDRALKNNVDVVFLDFLVDQHRNFNDMQLIRALLALSSVSAASEVKLKDTMFK